MVRRKVNLVAVAIDEWWPALDEQIRFWLVNKILTPIAPYTLREIEHVGGPGADDLFWERDSDGARFLPPEAIQWVTGCADFAAMSRPHEPDPRAAYFRRSWPRR